MLTNTEKDIRTVIRPSYPNIRSLATCVDIVAQRMFEENIPMDELMLTKDIYVTAAKQLHSSPLAVARHVERLVKRCWEDGDRERLNEIAGEPLTACPTVRDILVYFAYYSHREISFYDVIERR